MRDEIFKKPIKKQFEFDDSVASVFDDMISRSVPFYKQSSALIAEILASYLPQNASVTDLGCSTSQFLLMLYERRNDLLLCGVDNSNSMLEIANKKSNAFGAKIKFVCDDILNYSFKKQDCIILNYTLQFVRPPKRAEFVRKIYKSLNDNGIFVFSEKLIYPDKKLSKNMIEIYEKYKAEQGYSRYEISQKREALENILIPYTEEENKALAIEAGFSVVETIFKWGNFAVFVAFKK